MKQSSVSTLYTTDEYITKNPDLHESDSPWKLKKLLPFVSRLAVEYPQKDLVILDVGGGAGIILREIANFWQEKFDGQITKYCLDLSPGMLQVQQKNNPDAKIFQADIAQSGLANKEVDLLLLIDVLEHVEDPVMVLKEISRISKYALIKVPLEDTLYFNLMGKLTRGQFRQNIISSIGHINIYSAKSLRQQIQDNCGEVVVHDLTNVYEYLWNKKGESVVSKIFNFFGRIVYFVSPSLSAKIFNDYLVLLVKCR